MTEGVAESEPVAVEEGEGREVRVGGAVAAEKALPAEVAEVDGVGAREAGGERVAEVLPVGVGDVERDAEREREGEGRGEEDAEREGTAVRVSGGEREGVAVGGAEEVASAAVGDGSAEGAGGAVGRAVRLAQALTAEEGVGGASEGVPRAEVSGEREGAGGAVGVIKKVLVGDGRADSDAKKDCRGAPEAEAATENVAEESVFEYVGRGEAVGEGGAPLGVGGGEGSGAGEPLPAPDAVKNRGVAEGGALTFDDAVGCAVLERDAGGDFDVEEQGVVDTEGSGEGEGGGEGVAVALAEGQPDPRTEDDALRVGAGETDGRGDALGDCDALALLEVLPLPLPEADADAYPDTVGRLEGVTESELWADCEPCPGLSLGDEVATVDAVGMPVHGAEGVPVPKGWDGVGNTEGETPAEGVRAALPLPTAEADAEAHPDCDGEPPLLPVARADNVSPAKEVVPEGDWEMVPLPQRVPATEGEPAAVRLGVPVCDTLGVSLGGGEAEGERGALKEAEGESVPLPVGSAVVVRGGVGVEGGVPFAEGDALPWGEAEGGAEGGAEGDDVACGESVCPEVGEGSTGEGEALPAGVAVAHAEGCAEADGSRVGVLNGVPVAASEGALERVAANANDGDTSPLLVGATVPPLVALSESDTIPVAEGHPALPVGAACVSDAAVDAD